MTDSLVRCACHEVRLMTLGEMRAHMAESHPAVFEGLGADDGGLEFLL